MKFENVRVMNFEGAFRGMRNPLESWDKSDSIFGIFTDKELEEMLPDDDITLSNCILHEYDNKLKECAIIGKEDLKLAQNLIKAGGSDRKFMRQIFVSVDITAPLFWWKEFDTYKVGTTANSMSTMHKLSTTGITKECFEINPIENSEVLTEAPIVQEYIDYLEMLRILFLETRDKRYWRQLINSLPESWLQTRTVTMNYENILNIISQRKNHKLNEWSGKDNELLDNFISFTYNLPYAHELFIEPFAKNEK